MIRSRFTPVVALAASALVLGGCAVPYGPDPYNTAYPGSPTYGAPNQPGYANDYSYNGYGQVVNVQTYQGGGAAPSVLNTGTLIGGVAGGAIGNQIARKSDSEERAIATAAGAVVGALIGHVVQQQGGYGQYTGQTIYRVTVRGNDNQLRTFDYPQNPNVRIGENVRIQGQQLYRLS
ncbi:MAG: glycine zipper 2TM domain-containing protein [Brachymonas sp.]|nr:glycine zipper 2TM domain-containing protein [Brachymonas sp.]